MTTHLLITIGRIDKVGGRIVTAAGLGMEIGGFAECRPGLGPLLGHLEHVGRPLVAFYGFFYLVRATPGTRKKISKHAV